MREGKAEGKRGGKSTEAMVRVQDIDAYGTRLVVQLDDAWPLDRYRSRRQVVRLDINGLSGL